MVTIDDAKKVAETLSKGTDPVSVIVFGSVAKTGKGSDLDLLVVTEKEGMQAEVANCLRDFHKSFAIDYFVASLNRITENYRQGSPFLRLIQNEGRVLYMKNSIKEWITLATEDLRQAKYLFQGKFYRGACFAAQQAAEKAIKAELLKKGWDLEKIHNIRRLVNIAVDYNIHIVCMDDDIDFIDSLPLNPPSSEDASRSINIAENIFSQLKLPG